MDFIVILKIFNTIISFVGGGPNPFLYIIKPAKDIWRGSLIESLNMLTKPMMQTEVNSSFFFFCEAWQETETVSARL